MKRYLITFVVLTAAFGVPALFAGIATPPDTPSTEVLENAATGASGDVSADTAEVPDAVRAAARDGRYWRASQLMDRYLGTLSDTTESTILMAARLHAGWEDWTSVARLLEGREWLDQVEGGAGRELLGRSRIAQERWREGATELARYLDTGDTTARETGVAELRRGLALAEADDPNAALEAFDRAARALPWIGDWANLFAAETAAAAGDTAATRVRLAEAGSLVGERGWAIRLDAALEAGDSMAARELALEAGRTGGSATTRAAAWARLGTLRLASGDSARARAAFVEAMQTESAIGAVDAARALSDLDPSPEEWRRIADIYARHGNASRAATGYAAYLEAGAGTAEERLEARLRLGRALFNAGRYGEAERRLLELTAAESVPASVGAEALYLAGRAQYRQGRSQEGQRTLARLSERFPGQPAVTRGLFLLADLKHDDLELDDARRYYRAAAEASPSLNEAGLAMMRLGGLALVEEDYERAAEIFEEYRSLHPDGRRWGQSTYWAARAYQRMGREDQARARLLELREADPISYYGVRAAELLDVDALDIPMAATPATDSAADARVREGLRRVDVLGELGRRTELVREVERLRSEVEGWEAAEYALAESLIERGYTLSAIGMGWDIRGRSEQWNPRLLRIVYPFPFRQLVLPEVRERGLDPWLVAGLIRQESAFSPTVTSGAGAVGLMQVMPATGRELAAAAGLRDYDTDLLKQPEINVHLGSRFLATMLDRFDHQLPLVLSAYNAGPTRAERWRDFPEARDMELLTERVPYGETRDYIRRVLMHQAIYRALYPDIQSSVD